MSSILKLNLICLLLFVAGCVPANKLTTAEKTDKEESYTGQALPFSKVALVDLTGFRKSKGSNWKIVGAAYADRNKENDLAVDKGNGVLVNLANTKNGTDLFTTFEHGDIDLELDFMMPKGSNSGIFLQGRYELQVTDSWLKDVITAADCGGIGPNSANNTSGRPLVNASKAPGLWQHLKLRFKAPKFDSAGKKVSNARFDYVYLNEALVQKDAEVAGPTAGAAFDNEQAFGPLMLPGKQGAIAFKNIKYKTYQNSQATLNNLELKVFKTKSFNLDTLQYLTPITVKKVDSISHIHFNEPEKGIFQASLNAPEAGEYYFIIQAAGPSRLYIDSKLVADNKAVLDIMGYYSYDKPGTGKIYLTKGPHHFELIFAKRHGSLALSYEGPGIPFTELSAHSSARQAQNMEPYIVPVKSKPVMQRGFMLKDDVKLRRVISVGIPGGINYSYDLNNYALINAWHGKFIDAAPMWRSRGNPQLMLPLGGILDLYNHPTVAILPSDQTSWPDSVQVDADIFTNRGYKVSENGLPAFFYSINKADVEDHLYPSANNKGLTREIRINAKEPVQNLYCQIATGKNIQKLPDGSYAVDDQKYYLDQLEMPENNIVIRKQKERQSLIIPLKGNQVIKYSIIW